MGGHLDDEGVSECAFSPEQAAPGALEHAAGCADCSARIEELGRLLASLADLPEPEIPESVLIRLDATVERAWQEADAEADQKARVARRRRAKAWLPLAVPTVALGVIVGAVVGLSSLSQDGGAAPNAAGPASVPEPRAMNQTQLTTMARAALKAASTRSGVGAAAGTSVTVLPGAHPSVSASSSATFGALTSCLTTPARAGYTVAAVAAETYSGVRASLVVYRNDKEPASTTTFYAVLYAGSCPDASSPVLDQGLVSISR